MPKRYYTGDPHHQHINILKYENRPWDTIEEHDDGIIFNHNDMVKGDSITYCVGDFYFRGGKEAGNKHYTEFLKRYNGRYVIIRGNHEKHNNVIDSIQSATMYISGIKILCVHDPINANTKFDLVLCGHVHNQFKVAELQEKNKRTLIINVGVDVWNYRPVEWQDLYTIYEKWKCGKITPMIYDRKEVIKFREERRKKK